MATVWLLQGRCLATGASSPWCHSPERIILPPIFGNCFGTNRQAALWIVALQKERRGAETDSDAPAGL